GLVIYQKTAIAPLQARLLYRQLEIIVPDLAKAMVRHGTADVDWGKSLEHTDTVLYSLPKYIQWPWYKDRQPKKFTTISEEMKNFCCHVRMYGSNWGMSFDMNVASMVLFITDSTWVSDDYLRAGCYVSY